MNFDVKTLRDKKLLGVPYLYLAFVGVGVLVFIAWKMKNANTDTTTPDTSQDDGSGSGDGSASVGGTPDYSSLATDGTVTVQQGADPATINPVTVRSNDTWLSQGVTWLISQGLAGGGEAESALSTYLAGGQLSYSQGVLRDAVIKQYGLPPAPPIPGSTAAKPAQRQGNPPTVHTVQGTSDDSYTELANLYYGRTDGSSINLIRAHNPSLGYTGTIAKGTRVNIPVYAVPKYYTATTTTRSAAAIAAKNGTSAAIIQGFNSNNSFPVPVGTKVRVA